MKVEMPNETNVISIEVVRRSRIEKKLRAECTHIRTSVNVELNHLTCLDCGAHLNAVEWIAQLAEEWDRIQRMTAEYRAAAEKHEQRTRTKCRHCGQFTPVSC